MKNASVCSFGITMLRLTFSLLLVGFVAVSSVPLNEPTTELIPLQTTNMKITLEDMEKDEGVAKLNDSCDVDGQPCHLLPHSQCRDSKCQCEREYFEEDGKCLPGFGASCQNDAGCAQKNLTCLHGKCGCDGHYSPLSEICQKMPTKLGDFCHEALPCDRIENSYCGPLNCMCDEDYIEQNGRCVPDFELPCKDMANCVMECSPSGKCEFLYS